MQSYQVSFEKYNLEASHSGQLHKVANLDPPSRIRGFESHRFRTNEMRAV